MIDFMKKDKGAKDFLEKHPKAQLFTTEMNIFEVVNGIFLQKTKMNKELYRFLNFVESIELVVPQGQFSFMAAKTAAFLQKKGTPIEDMDCLIASMMENFGLTNIVTRDKSHFSRIPGIKVVGY